MLDGLLLEEAGLPAAVICTRPFLPTGRAMAEARGVPGYPFALSDHPISNRAPDDLRKMAEAVLDEVAALLLRGAEAARG